ncbi:MAG: hypothetical protein H7336_03205, partial [Bacteriovorax sp.]|nr:hypothetical protein [Bacteriovorax sp.]
MPYLLILISLIFVSCGVKENALSKLPSSTYSLEQRTFITIKHEDGKSIIRSKILNQFVEEEIPSTEAAIQIDKGDELIGNEMDQRDLKIYAANEKSMAKIIVSFTDHEEIFFVPKDVPLKTITARLNLKPEAERVFKWI